MRHVPGVVKAPYRMTEHAARECVDNVECQLIYRCQSAFGGTRIGDPHNVTRLSITLMW